MFQIPRDAKHKLVYIAKKNTESIGVNDLPQMVLFGELPASSLGHITTFLDEVLVKFLILEFFIYLHDPWNYLAI